MPGIEWTHAVPSMLAAFLASLVEFVEALTVVLAVGSVRGWRDALGGSVAALAVLLALVVTLGAALTSLPLEIVRIGVGALLLLFGLRWLRKAVLRAAGRIPLHDEVALFARQSAALRSQAGSRAGWDRLAFATAFQITMLEGIEVVFIVIAIGAGDPRLLLPAGLGAVGALLAVIALGAMLHRPLARVPENTLKFFVGVVLCAFGIFWLGEGLGLGWADWTIFALIAAVAAASLLAVRLTRAPA